MKWSRIGFAGAAVLALALTVGVFGSWNGGDASAQYTPPAAAARTEGVSLAAQPSGGKTGTDLVLVIKNTDSVIVEEVDQGALALLEGTERYTFSVSAPVNGVTTATLVQKAEYENKDWSGDLVTLTIPKGAYKSVSVQAEDSGVKLFPQTFSYTMDGEDCAVSAKMASAYTGRLTINCTDSAVSFQIMGKPENLSLRLDAKDCAVSAPKDWGYKQGQVLALNRGTGGATVEMTLSDCSVSLSESKVDFYSSYEGLSGTTAMAKRDPGEALLGRDADEDLKASYRGNMDVSGWKDLLNQYKKEVTPNTVLAVGEVPAAGITGLHVRADLCGVVLEPSQSGKFEITKVGAGDGSNLSAAFEVKDGILTVTAEGAAGRFYYVGTQASYRANTVRIGVPKDVLKQLTVDCGTALIYSYGVPLPQVTGVATNGTVYLQTDTVNQPVAMECSNGTVYIKAQRVTADVTMSARNGSVGVEAGACTGKLELAAQNGAAELTADEVANARLRAENGMVEAEIGTITGSVYAGVSNGDLEFNLKPEPQNLRVKLIGNWEQKKWQDYDSDDNYDDKHAYGIRLPNGWKDGYTVGNGKPVLELEIGNGTADIEVG